MRSNSDTYEKFLIKGRIFYHFDLLCNMFIYYYLFRILLCQVILILDYLLFNTLSLIFSKL